LAAGLLEKVIPIKPIANGDYPQAARRPAYSVLDTRTTTRLFDVDLEHWRVALRKMLTQRQSRDAR
jgi:dTDP-4-dehydrorhamnose reductase